MRADKLLVPVIAAAAVLHIGEMVAPQTCRAEERRERVAVGVSPLFMPVGWFDLADAWNRKFRAYPALGLAVYGDYLVNGYLSIGVSPEVVWNIVPSRADDLVGTMYAANLRIGARYPGFRLVEPYGVLAGGYSIITLADSNNSAKGFLISAVAGLRLKLWPRHSLFGEAGYQKGFQRLAGGAYAPSFLITGAGWQMVFR